MATVLSVLIVALGLGLGVVAVARYVVVFPRLHVPAGDARVRDSVLEARLEAHVRAVASVPHNVAHYEDLEAAARYIEATATAFGHVPVAHVYGIDGVDVRNIEVVLEPAEPGAACCGTIVIGAHYDSPDDSPGANDNGTGVALLLELARVWAGRSPAAVRLRLVFFVNEEQPYGHTDGMGSWRYARHLRERGERVDGMIALETLGYFSDRPGSQSFPWPFNLVYPDRGTFVAFVGLPGVRGFMDRAIGAFRAGEAMPSIGGVVPAFVPGAALSDHWSFHQFGFPALMVTDTAPFRNPYYHQPTDTPDTVDYQSLARVTAGMVAMVETLALGGASADR